MNTGPVTTHLVDEILTKKARKHGVVVWYDPPGAFKRVVDTLAIDRVRIVRFKGSFYQLRYEAEAAFSRLDRNSIAGEDSVIVYVDRTPLDKQSDVLLGLEKAGTRFDWSLAAVVRDALKGRVPRETLDSWLANEKILLDDVERLSAGDLGAGMSTVGVIFETTVASDVAVRYLAEPALAAEVESKGGFDQLRDLFVSAFALPAEGISSQEILRKRLGRHILLTEFVADVVGSTPTELQAVPVARTATQVDNCRRVARSLRDRWRSREDYAVLAHSIETEFGLRLLKIAAAALGNLDTFPFSEEVVLRSLGQLAKNGQTDLALERVKEREGSFWSVVNPVRAIQWQTAQTALDLYREATRVLDEVKQSKVTPENLSRNYIQGAEGRGRWCVMDSLDRRLEWLTATAECELQVDDLIELARQQWRSAGGLLAERFQQAIRSEGFSFGELRHQADTFSRFLRPAMEKGPVAYFLINGIRYEQASDLLSSLAFADRSELHAAIAVPPSIPAIGLSALLPGAEAGVTLREKSGKLLVEVDGVAFADSTDRLRFLKRRLGEDAVIDLPLADVLTKKAEALRKRTEGKKLIVVRSPDFDGLPSEMRAQTRKLMGDLLADVRRAIRRMAELGIFQVVVASSHGCLLSWNLDESTAEPPDGRTVDLGARSWIGKGGGDRPVYFRFRADHLGMGGDLDIAVPVGLQTFKVGSENLPFLSGGMSPQELLVPIAVIGLSAPSSAGVDDQFDLALAKERITNRLFTVTVRYHKGSLLSADDKRVRVVVRSGRDEVGRAATAVHGFDQATGEITLIAGQEEHVTIMLTTELQQGSLIVAIVDSDTEATLKQTAEIPYDLPI